MAGFRTYRRSALAGAFMLMAAPAAVAQVCLSDADRAAFEMRHLQTQLMVGAIQCRGERDLGQRYYYNRFAKTQRDLITRSNAALKAFFKRTHGRAYRGELDTYVTDLANTVSSASRHVEDFCAQVADTGLALGGKETGTVPDWRRIARRAPVAFEAPHPRCQQLSVSRDGDAAPASGTAAAADPTN